MALRRLLSKSPGQLLNIFRTRYGRFSDPVCRHDPAEIMVFITTRCNLKCHTCPFMQTSPYSPPPGVPDIEPGFLDRVLDEYHRCTLVGLVGGEPLLHKDILKLIDIVAAHRMAAHISTNGLLLNENTINALLDSPLTALNISIDAADADDYRRLRNGSPAQFEAIRRNAERICNERHRRNSSLAIGLSYVTDRRNLQKIPDFARWAAGIGADRIMCQNILPYQCSDITTGSNTLTDTPDTRAELAGLRLPENLHVSLPVLTPVEDDKRCVHCIHPFKMLSFDGAGNLSPCCIIPPHPQYGSLKNDITAWRNTPPLVKIRTEMLNGDDAFADICLDCWERFSMGQHED